MFQRLKIKEIQHTALLLRDTPSSSDSFAHCQSMRTRRRRKLPAQMPMAALTKLKIWVADPESSILMAQVQGVRASSLDFAVDFLEAVCERNYLVVWALRSNLEPGSVAPPFAAILRSLISQVLELLESVPITPSVVGISGPRTPRLTLADFKKCHHDSSVVGFARAMRRCRPTPFYGYRHGDD